MNRIFNMDNGGTKVLLYLFFALTVSSLILLLPQKEKGEVLSSTDAMLLVDLNIAPSLDFSLFSPYTISATNVPETPSDVKLNLSVDMGDGNVCWDFTEDGVCASQAMSLNMTYNPNTNAYERNIYPDQIYPEIFFAPSSMTWGNQPLDMSVRRNEYHILHMANPFTMVSDMSFWIELNSVPVSTVNSSDLQIYLVEKGHDITYFNTDWMNNSGVELVGTFTKTTPFHHVHSSNSSHHLVRLTTDSNGKVGNKLLDISGDFWIVLYSNSPNNNRGWNLRYQPSTLCDTNNAWYRGNITGWSTIAQAGCPDSHIHISRRNINYTDIVNAYVSATYDTGTFNSPVEEFSFVPLPNLPPNPTSFTTPTVGTRYSGNLNIQWDPATDPNTGDTLTYNIYITPLGGTQTTLISNTSSTSFILDTTLYEDNEYSLQGEVCDTTNPCVDFALDGIFYIDNIVIPETLSSVSITSSNSNTGYAKDGDIVTLSYTSSGAINVPLVSIYSGGNTVSNTVYTSEGESNIWTSTYEVENTDTSGQVTFEILSSNLDTIYYQTTDSTDIIVDVTPPPQPISSLDSGQYIGSQEITLTSESNATILYSTDGSDVNCGTGIIYDTPIDISSSLTLKAIACDMLDNGSDISTYTYDIKESLSSISITSSNSSTLYAKVGDTITLSFTATNTINTPTVIISASAQLLLGDITLENTQSNTWVATHIVQDGDSNGLVSFTIDSDTLYTQFTETTDLSRVYIDTVSPISPISSITSGTYPIAQTLSLTSSPSSVIRYTIDGSTPTCLIGNIYLSSIAITTSTVLKAVSCDLAGNQSPLSTTSIAIFPDTIVIPEEDDTSDEEIEELTDDTDEDTEEEENSEDIGGGEKAVDHSTSLLPYTTIVTSDGSKKILSVFKVRLLDESGNPIKYTNLTIYSTPQSSRTDLSGIATFFNLPIDTHTVVYAYEGEEYREEIDIVDIYTEGIHHIGVIDINVSEDNSLNILLYISIVLSLLITFVISRLLIEKRVKKI